MHQLADDRLTAINEAGDAFRQVWKRMAWLPSSLESYSRDREPKVCLSLTHTSRPASRERHVSLPVSVSSNSWELQDTSSIYVVS